MMTSIENVGKDTEKDRFPCVVYRGGVVWAVIPYVSFAGDGCIRDYCKEQQVQMKDIKISKHVAEDFPGKKLIYPFLEIVEMLYILVTQ